MPHLAGSSTPVLFSIEEIFDPQYGLLLRQSYHGARAGIERLAVQMGSLGFRARAYNEGSRWIAEVESPTPTTGNGAGQEAPVDKWNISTETEQVAIWKHPKVLALAGGSITQLAAWRKEIEDAVKNGTPLATAPSEQELSIYNLVVRGVESTNEKHIVLRRDRTTSPYYATPIIVTAIEKFYSTAALIRIFGVPARLWPALPGGNPLNPFPSTTPTDTNWGWVLRKQESEVVLSINKVQETMDWIFGAVSTVLYEYVP